MSPLLSIIVPVYNEERTLKTIMDTLTSACSEAQIIYVDDGSKDKSLAILKENAREQDIILTKKNGGKGSAIRMGLLKADRKYTIIQDADLEYDPRQIQLLLNEARAHKNTGVFGSRFLKKNPNIYKRFLLGNKALTFLVNILFNARLTDSYTCYKLFPTHIFQSFPLTAHGFELEAELSAFPLKKKIPIREVPIDYQPRSIEEGKKIGLADAWKGCKRFLQIRLSSKY